MSVFKLFEIAGILFEGAFSLWVSLKLILLQPKLQYECVNTYSGTIQPKFHYECVMFYESSFVFPAWTIKLQGTDHSYLKKLLEQ